ncbi:MAG: efflux transporter periplasmic adaptor subunit [Bradyrhizobiaceae bacterium PARB1]|jgi:membrane fusion protein, multidrug efflux system|nr:MAG: efflux transporter periplasmic adaptor subunit [Bradyrhizobiaceae bacterium PARB1]
MITRKHHIAALAGVALLLTGAGAVWHVASAPAKAQAAAALPEVELVTVGERPVAEQRSFSGRIAAISQVDIRPLVSGTITGVHFKDGDLVRKGAPLFTIDPRPFQAALDRAAGDLKAAEAAVAFARIDFERAQRLIGNSVISQREYDKRQQDIRDGDARVAVAQAVVDAARLDVEHATISAPIDGRISRAEITLGNIVTAGAAAPALTRIVSVSPVYVEFDADEQSYLAFVSRAHGNSGFLVDLALAGEREFTRSGRITSVDNRLDTASGTIRVRALFDNPEGRLVPGLYARIRVSGSEVKPALLVDARAVNVDQDKKFTFVVGADGRVAYRELRLGDDRDGRRLVLSGLKAGEKVVVAGAQSVKPGDQVKVISSEAAVK